MFLVAAGGGCRSLVERVVGAVHQRILTEHRSHLETYEREIGRR